MTGPAAAAPLRVLLADDEAPARARLRRLLLAHPQITVVAEARDGVQALHMTELHRPDALFLDVQMPEADGLAVAASLPDPAPAIVFVTAFDHYALPAFDAAALDYLLKPVDAERVARAVQRLLARGAPSAAPAHPPPRQLLIPERGRIAVVEVAAIEWLEAADNYVAVHAGEARAPLLRRTLTALLGDLGDGFVRTQRGAAVALAHVSGLRSLGKGDALVMLRSGAEVPCSRQHRALLVQRLGARR
ncbi:MAG: response regulator transcription factor [Ideonella sp.]|nr:response regulator transcription factor [Ideonella sp.]MCC7457197.1 response regulator transcription factor [Nitrospira sp.]